jgi:NDP-sugar pyrophosphorylase family protein
MFETVILLGPEAELFPVVNERLPKICIPIVNKPLLLHTVEFLQSVSKKIYFVGLSEQKNALDSILDISTPHEYIGIETYDGTVASLLVVRPFLTSEDVIVCKGDVVSGVDIGEIVGEYIRKKKVFMTVLGPRDPPTCLVAYNADGLVFYADGAGEEIPFRLLKSQHALTVTKELDVVPLYLFKTALFDLFRPEHFSFKKALLPTIVQHLAPTNPVGVHMVESGQIVQINSIESYLSINKLLKMHMPDLGPEAPKNESHSAFIKSYVRKHNLKDFKNVVGERTETDGVLLLNSILGRRCRVDAGSKIISSILMDDVFVGRGCYIEKSIIGSGAVIAEGTWLIDCRVAPGFKFPEALKAESQMFNC